MSKIIPYNRHKEEFKPLTKEQFFKIFPPETRNIAFGDLNGKIEIISNLGEQVICDFCNADVFDDEHNVGYGLFVDDNPVPCEMVCEQCGKKYK